VSERLRNEFAGVLETLDRSDVAWLHSARGDGLEIAIEFEVRSLYCGERGTVEERDGVVAVHYKLHPDHPLVPPIAVANTPGLFNVHINDPVNVAPHLPPIPLVCLGPFLPQMRLSDWVVATYDLLRWACISTQRPLNEAAARYARLECATPGRFPVDSRGFWRDDVGGGANEESAAAGGGDTARGAGSTGLRLGPEWRMT
jgi:hypothetical protein